MNRIIGVWLVVFGLLLAGLSFYVYTLAAANIGRPVLISGLAGGALCVVWGVRGIAGRGGKALPILTLIPVLFVMLSQTIVSWSAAAGSSSGRLAAGTITILLVVSLMMLLRIAWSGVLFDKAQPSVGVEPGSGPTHEPSKAFGKSVSSR